MNSLLSLLKKEEYVLEILQNCIFGYLFFVFGSFLAMYWPYPGHIWPGGASGLNFFIDARDGTAGGRMSRASMKK